LVTGDHNLETGQFGYFQQITIHHASPPLLSCGSDFVKCEKARNLIGNIFVRENAQNAGFRRSPPLRQPSTSQFRMLPLLLRRVMPSSRLSRTVCTGIRRQPGCSSSRNGWSYRHPYVPAADAEHCSVSPPTAVRPAKRPCAALAETLQVCWQAARSLPRP
jgi:hypothetical protein